MPLLGVRSPWQRFFPILQFSTLKVVYNQQHVMMAHIRYSKYNLHMQVRLNAQNMSKIRAQFIHNLEPL